MNLTRRFIGIRRLYGNENYQKIGQAHVCVVGLGGVGSWVVEALARSGVGQLTIIDLDNVSESNVNRQLTALTSNFGKAKVDVLKERVLEINPQMSLTAIEDMVDEENYQLIFSSKFDFVVDAIDEVKIKVLLANHFVDKGQPFIVSGGAGGKRSAGSIQTLDISEVTHDKLLAKMRYQLRKKYHFPKQGKMYINCVCSKENMTLPESCESSLVSNGLSCAGYGASMVVTAGFAMQLAEKTLDWIINA